MIRLRLLGPPDVDGPGAEIPAAGQTSDAANLLRQPKAIALLVYLALATPRGFHSRDTLMALLWPELDEDRGRKALRQTLYEIRSALGKAAIENRGYDAVALGREVVKVDAVALEERLETGEAEAALELYRGELLEGFWVPEASVEWEQWLDGERSRLARLARNAAEELAAGAAAEVEATASSKTLTAETLNRAVRLSRRAVELAPLDEAPVARLLGLLGLAGRRGAVEEVYSAYEARLEELGGEPSTELTERFDSARERAASPGPATAPATTPPDGAAREVRMGSTPPATGSVAPHRRFAIAAVLAVALAGLGALAWAVTRGDSEAPPLDADRVVVLPFRVSGAEPSVAYLSEGMMDLLAVRLSGEAGPRAVHPATAVRTWRESDGGTRPGAELGAPDPVVAEEVARRLGAGKILLGEVTGNQDRLEVSATLRALEGGGTQRAVAHGPVDSLPEMVDRLAAALLSQEAGASAGVVAYLADVPLAALRAYLEGEAAHRSGAYQEAYEAYGRAIELDSTFALAAYRYSLAAGWVARDRSRGIELARRSIDRLPPAERRFMEVYESERVDTVPDAARLDRWLELVDLMPDRAAAWSGAADMYFHFGSRLGVRDWREQARRYFGRAVALEPTYNHGLHLLHLQLLAGDTAAADSTLRILGDPPEGETAIFLRWLRAAVAGDTATLAEMRGEVREWPWITCGYIGSAALEEGVGLGVATACLEEVLERPLPPSARQTMLLRGGEHYMSAGQVDRALEMFRAVEPLDPVDTRSLVLAGLFGPVPPAETDAAAERIMARHPLPDSDEASRDACVLAQHAARRGDFGAAGRYLAEVEAIADATPGPDPAGWCAAIAEAVVAAEEGRPDALELLLRADSLMLRGVRLERVHRQNPEIAIAHYLERLGQPERALDVASRHTYWTALFLRTDQIRLEGALADRLGQHDRAAAAYRRYLALRYDPDPSLAAERLEVEHALARLMGDPPP